MDLVEIYSALDAGQVMSWISSRQEEHLQLEFKTLRSSDLSHKDDRSNLAKCISGFANSAGGIVVWGVVADVDSNGIDAASAPKEIRGLDQLLARLNSLTGSAASPIVDGVLHRALPTTPNRGFAVTLVPETESGPHMAKLGENKYYKRSGDSFYLMEHFDLQDMFGRRKQPRLALYTHVRSSGLSTSIVIGITNEGRGSAKAPYLGFTAPSPFILSQFGVDGNRHEGLPRLFTLGMEYRHLFGGSADAILHPGVTLQVTSLDLGIPTPKHVVIPPTVAIPYQITAEDTRMTSGVATVDLGQAAERQ